MGIAKYLLLFRSAEELKPMIDLLHHCEANDYKTELFWISG